MNERLPCPTRRRQIPRQFSWIDQRLARHNYFQHAPSEAWALYLFLLTVADAQGVSYYSERGLCQRLDWDPARLSQARQRLVALELVAYQAPFYQVLALPDSLPPPLPPRVRHPSAYVQARHHLQQLRQQLRGPRS